MLVHALLIHYHTVKLQGQTFSTPAAEPTLLLNVGPGFSCKPGFFMFDAPLVHVYKGDQM